MITIKVLTIRRGRNPFIGRKQRFFFLEKGLRKLENARFSNWICYAGRLRYSLRILLHLEIVYAHLFMMYCRKKMICFVTSRSRCLFSESHVRYI